MMWAKFTSNADEEKKEVLINFDRVTHIEQVFCEGEEGPRPYRTQFFVGRRCIYSTTTPLSEISEALCKVL